MSIDTLKWCLYTHLLIHMLFKPDRTNYNSIIFNEIISSSFILPFRSVQSSADTVDDIHANTTAGDIRASIESRKYFGRLMPRYLYDSANGQNKYEYRVS